MYVVSNGKDPNGTETGTAAGDLDQSLVALRKQARAREKRRTFLGEQARQAPSHTATHLHQATTQGGRGWGEGHGGNNSAESKKDSLESRTYSARVKHIGGVSHGPAPTVAEPFPDRRFSMMRTMIGGNDTVCTCIHVFIHGSCTHAHTLDRGNSNRIYIYKQTCSYIYIPQVYLTTQL